MHEGSTVDIYDPDMETTRSKWIGLSETQLIIGNSKSAPGREPRVIPLESITDVVQGCRGVRAGSAPEAPWRSFCIALGAQGRVQCVAASCVPSAAVSVVGRRLVNARAVVQRRRRGDVDGWAAYDRRRACSQTPVTGALRQQRADVA